ncbi:hypothetical protein D5073_12370 [Pectobacterium versatile]|nr:hypothetical protein D5073_12370 [Pectobacterium versatile]RJL63459.1 hypothetical protein D5080_10165 [Pectobacterium versatile]
MAALLGTLACASPRWGRCKQRSNLLKAGLSVTRITYLSKLIGIPSLAAFLKLELFRVYNCHASHCSRVLASLLFRGSVRLFPDRLPCRTIVA